MKIFIQVVKIIMTEAEKEKHKKYIKKCHDLAIKSGKNGYDSFGALVVYEDEILETAQNTADYDKGLFGHAEFNVVHKCANKYSDHILKNSTLYTSCAPRSEEHTSELHSLRRISY